MNVFTVTESFQKLTIVSVQFFFLFSSKQGKRKTRERKKKWKKRESHEKEEGRKEYFLSQETTAEQYGTGSKRQSLYVSQLGNNVNSFSTQSIQSSNSFTSFFYIKQQESWTVLTFSEHV